MCLACQGPQEMLVEITNKGMNEPLFYNLGSMCCLNWSMTMNRHSIIHLKSVEKVRGELEIIEFE